MAKALSSRRRKAADEWANPPGGEQRQAQSNATARADTIRMAVRELARMESERKAISAEIAEFKATHIKGDLGFKIADFNAIYRVSQLETEDRDVLLDTLREGFAALDIGGTLDWVTAALATGAAPDPDAFELGKADALAGHRDHAGRYPKGEILANAYELGHQAGLRERHAGEGNGVDPAPAVTPKRSRGRPRKGPPPPQPGLSIVEGTGDDAAA